MTRGDFQDGTSTDEQFFAYINERYLIWKRREAGQERPWTDDAILHEWSFCNVFREWDAGTQALREMLRAQLVPMRESRFDVRTLSYEERLAILRNILIYRLWNLAEHAREHGWIKDVATFIEYIRKRRRDGRKVFSAAYLMTSAGLSVDKAELFIGTTQTLWDRAKEVPIFDSLEVTADWLARNIYLVGRFVAQEMVQDLRQIKGFLYEAKDTITWAHAGPGAHRGLRRLGLPVGRTESVTSMRTLLARALEYLHSDLELHLSKWMGGHAKYPLFDLHVIEFNLCEFDKYERCRLEQGKLRRRYKPKEVCPTCGVTLVPGQQVLHDLKAHAEK